jgi:predicted DNA-binding transcriptional regulator YafY
MAAFREELAGDWKAMLAHQLPALPPVSAFWDVLPAFFDWLTDRGDLRPAAAERLHANDDDLVLQDPRGASTVPRTIAAMLENIRFAGANRLLVELDYLATTGARETRRIEPYSLRRTKTGDVVLHALRADTHEHRSYRLDRIRGVRILNEAFQPRYQIELTPQGSQPVLPRR